MKTEKRITGISFFFLLKPAEVNVFCLFFYGLFILYAVST